MPGAKVGRAAELKLRTPRLAPGLKRRLYLFGFRQVGKGAAGDAAEFGADDVCGKTGAEEAAVQRSDFALVERAADMSEFALDAGADRGGFVGFGEHGVERGVDVGVVHAAGA